MFKILQKNFLSTTLCLPLILLTACAFGTKMSFSKTSLTVPPVDGELIIAVTDQRPYVLSGDKSPEWIGLQRGGWGIPYGVHTDSGKPLAQEFGESLSDSFSRQTKVTLLGPQSSEALLKKEVERNSNSKGLLLAIHQWRSDTLQDVTFEYDLRLSIVDNKGKTLATEVVSSKEALDGSFWNPVAASEKAVVKRQQALLEELLGRARVRQTLSGR